MGSTTVRIGSSEGGGFDCHVAVPAAPAAAPAVVLASSIYGVDADLRGIADEFAAQGCLAVAPDLFWRTLPGELARGDPRAALRAQPRLDCIRTGERDLADVLAFLRQQPLCNGHAVLVGFCYGGPYAILGPKRLGYAAGMSCHGSRMLEFAGELEGTERPVRIDWGELDEAASAPMRDRYRASASRMKNVQVGEFPGLGHGYMMRSNPAAFDPAAYTLSIARALALLHGLRTLPGQKNAPRRARRFRQPGGGLEGA